MRRWLVTIALLIPSVGCAARSPVPTAFAAQESERQLLLDAHRAQLEGDTLRAQQYLLSALNRGADQRRVLPWLLRLYVADGQYRSAIERVNESLRVQSDDVQLRMLLATLYRATELHGAAAAQYEEVLQREPTEARAHLDLAMMLHEDGAEPARADQHFRAFLALVPNAPEASSVRSRLLKEIP